MSNLLDVYDLFYPSPTTLKEMAVIKLAIELWRQEIIKHRTDGTLDKLTFKDNISSSILESQAPSVILPIIDEYIGVTKVSIKGWLNYHTFEKSILQNFDDFVGDFGGDIHYQRTAQQIILCDGVSQVEKFKIACLYCLENDIEKLWPSVSSEIDLNEVKFSTHPQLFYWICRLRNQLYKIPVPRTLRNNVDGAMIFRIIYNHQKHWSTIKYFLNRLDSSRRMCCVKYIFTSTSSQQLFYRYVLAKLSKEEFDEFLVTNRSALWSFIYQNMESNSNNVMSVWTYISAKVDENDFVNLFQQILARQPTSKTETNKPTPYLEIWSAAPDNYKQSAIQRVLLSDSLFRSDGRFGDAPSKHLTLLKASLSEASAEDRSTFWNKHWCDLMLAMNIGDFRQLMELCFKDEDEINRYKETVMCDYEKIGRYCLKLFSSANFEKLDEVLNFLCVGEQQARIIRSHILSENFGINGEHLKKASVLNDFINGAFDDLDRAAEFKNRLLLKSTNVKNFESFVTNGMLKSVKEFIDAVIPSEAAVKDFKKQCMVPIFRQYLTYATFLKQENEEYLDFLRWCAGENDDEIAEFKQTLPVDEVVQEVIRQEMQGKRKSTNSAGRAAMTYYPKLVEFLKWYFVTMEAYEEFLAKYAEDDVFVKLITESKPNEKDEKSEENETSEKSEKMEESEDVEQVQKNEQVKNDQQPEQVQDEQNVQLEQEQGEQNVQPEQVQGEQNVQLEQVQGEQNVQPEQVQGQQIVQPEQDEPMMVD